MGEYRKIVALESWGSWSEIGGFTSPKLVFSGLGSNGLRGRIVTLFSGFWFSKLL